jgi:hypothetical protein
LERLEDIVPAGLNLPSAQQLFSEVVAVLQTIVTVQVQAGIPSTSEQWDLPPPPRWFRPFSPT